MASIELGPKVGDETTWHEEIWADDWVVGLTASGNTATLIYVHIPGDTPYIVNFKGVTHLVQAQPGPNELGDGTVSGSPHSRWLSALDQNGEPVFELEYSEAYAQKLEWIRFDNRFFSEAKYKKQERRGVWIILAIYLFVAAIVVVGVWLRA
jgi:hypothetical protein